ncbi:MAG: alpha/beta hydrolase, partial [Acidobacteria bacterium]|nr:alpha/beta hydrolase [Acidobacteriota bacterium]
MRHARCGFGAAAAAALAVAVGLGAAPAAAQTDDAAAAFVRVATGYSLTPNITYHRAGGRDLTLDVYRPRGAAGPNPTLIYIHGGGWTNGSKEGSALTFLPYLEMGWSVVNVAYRLADAAHAPAAVEDCRCALRWVYRNAERMGFDVGRIVVTGNSAGGHLALTTGMLPASAGLDRQCPGDRRRVWTTGTTSTAPLEVAAIINWYGITD